MRIWGRVEGPSRCDDGELAGSIYVFGWIDLMPGAKVDLFTPEGLKRGTLVEEFGTRSAWNIGGTVTTFGPHEVKVICRRENTGIIQPDHSQRQRRLSLEAIRDLMRSSSP